jgi:hypothetical protein
LGGRSAAAVATPEDKQDNCNLGVTWPDVKILQFFINEFKAPEGPLSDEQLRKTNEKTNKQRLNKIRYRHRKQLENEHLKKTVVNLEKKLQMLKETARMRLYIHGPNQWEELMKVEKKKRENAEEEFELLQNSIDAHDKLLQLYYKSKNSLTDDDGVYC